MELQLSGLKTEPLAVCCFLPYGITGHSVVSPYLQSPSHRLETDWSSGIESNLTNLSQAFAGRVLMPASLNPFRFAI